VPFKGQTVVEGTLVGRDADFVILTQKGRAIKIPRAEVQEVRLPPPLFEEADFEIKKLR
jgi:ribosome maturation factor RimP